MTDLHLDPAAAEAFRQRHPLRQVDAGGHTWSYLRGGRGGGTPVLFLPGVLGEAYDAAFLLAPLENEIAFLAPTIPPVATAAELVQGIVAILDREGIPKVVLAGGSYAALLAQAFFHRRPDRVAHLLLYDGTGPDRRHGRRNPRNVWFWRVLPLFLLRAFFQRRFNFQLRSPPGLSAEQEAVLRALRGRYAEKAARLERATALSELALAIEINAGDPVDAAPLGGWSGKIVILGPADAPRLAAGQGILAKVFPGAEWIRTRCAGILGSVLQPDPYRAAVRRLAALE